MSVTKQPGEVARIRVLGGPDHGSVYVVTSESGGRVVIGRGQECDIILADIKTSRRHAELSVGSGGLVSLKDLGSSHGILVNGKVQKLATLKSGDKVGLGETVLEFIASEISGTQTMMKIPPRTTAAVGTGDSGMTQFIPRPNMGPAQASSKNGPATGGFIERNKRVMLIVGVLMGLAVLIPEVEQKQKAKMNKYLEPKELDSARGLSSLNQVNMDPNVVKNADNYFKEGFREFRSRNYLRAQVAFETALQVYPDHALATIYLASTKKEMEDEAKEHFEGAKRDEEANRIKSALSKYEAVKRLFAKDQSNPLYKEAEQRATEMEKKMNGEAK